MTEKKVISKVGLQAKPNLSSTRKISSKFITKKMEEKINHYWSNLDDQPQDEKKPKQVNDSELEVFNKGGHWYSLGEWIQNLQISSIP